MNRHQPAPSITDWSQVPLICDVSHVAMVYGRTVQSVTRGVSRGTFPVMPFMVRPMRWKRCDLEDHYRHGTPAGLRRRA